MPTQCRGSEEMTGLPFVCQSPDCPDLLRRGNRLHPGPHPASHVTYPLQTAPFRTLQRVAKDKGRREYPRIVLTVIGLVAQTKVETARRLCQKLNRAFDVRPELLRSRRQSSKFTSHRVAGRRYRQTVTSTLVGNRCVNLSGVVISFDRYSRDPDQFTCILDSVSIQICKDRPASIVRPTNQRITASSPLNRHAAAAAASRCRRDRPAETRRNLKSDNLRRDDWRIACRTRRNRPGLIP